MEILGRFVRVTDEDGEEVYRATPDKPLLAAAGPSCRVSWRHLLG